MSADVKRIVEVRMIVIVLVDLTHPNLRDAMAASGRQPSSLVDIVSSEVVSNLESVSYIESAIVSYL